MKTQHSVVGIDLAKNSFYTIALDDHNRVQERKILSRNQLIEYFVNKPTCTVAMEACASSHYWARTLSSLGHTVQLLPAQYVKGYARGQKNDYNDAQAIAEACHHGAIRPVPAKTVEQQDEATFTRIRQQLVQDRTRLLNHVRGVLAEYGIVIPVGRHSLAKRLPEILEDAENGLTYRMRAIMSRQHNRIKALDEELEWYEEQLKRAVETDQA